MSKEEYTKEESTINDYLIMELKARNNLAEHLTAIMDSGAFKDPHAAIDSVMDPEKHESLLHYLIIVENYEDCSWLKRAYDAIFVKTKRRPIQEL